MSFPLLDVSELLDDPLFVQTAMTVLRRKQVLTKGRSAPAVYQVITGVAASVQPKDTAIGGNFIERTPDMEYRGSNLNVYTKFRLRGVTKQATGDPSDGEYLPDIIVVNGDYFIVALTNDWSHYGAGFMHAEVESTEAVDYAPDGAP
jgi:hypothetical protein